jgi:hypothetical protein
MSGHQRRNPLAAALLLTVLLLAVLLAAKYKPHRAVPVRANSPKAIGVRAQSPRRIYPFSVIPGGVFSPAELREVLEKDAAAAAHYAGFDVNRAELIRLEKPHSAYVSFRYGNRIFWTTHKVMLAKDEALLSDGSHLIRTRCGNRISFTREEPVIPAEEPDEFALDWTDESGDGWSDGWSEERSSSWRKEPTPSPSPSPSPSPKPARKSLQAGQKRLQSPLQNPGSPLNPNDPFIPTLKQPPVATVVAPEPGTWFLMIASFVMLLIAKRKVLLGEMSRAFTLPLHPRQSSSRKRISR